MGNVLLTKKRFDLYHYAFINDKYLKRGTRLEIFVLYNQLGAVVGIVTEITTNKRIGYCSAHLTAYQDYVKVRLAQMKQLKKALELPQLSLDGNFIFGDLNFHVDDDEIAIEETKYTDLWKVTHPNGDPGYTFDAATNHLVKAKYFRLERRRMRLDRILMSSSLVDVVFAATKMKIFANEPIYPSSNWDYLGCSDHFGLYMTITTNPSNKYVADPKEPWDPAASSTNLPSRMPWILGALAVSGFIAKSLL
jgi:hypothetical protein